MEKIRTIFDLLNSEKIKVIIENNIKRTTAINKKMPLPKQDKPTSTASFKALNSENEQEYSPNQPGETIYGKKADTINITEAIIITTDGKIGLMPF